MEPKSHYSIVVIGAGAAGLVIAIGKEEAVIRQNPNELGSTVVDKVFDYYNRQKQGNGSSLSF